MALDVLVTGASGALGSSIVKELRSRGRTVLACAREAGVADAIWDIALPDGPTVDEVPRTIVHTAARRASLDNKARDEQLWDVNVGGTARVVEWALRSGVKRIVVTSGALVYGEWSAPRREEDEPNAAAAGYYALSKWAAERIALTACEAKCDVSILRLASLYGAEYKSGLIRHFLSQAKVDGRIRVDPPLDDAFDLLHLRDAAAVVANTVEHDQCGLWNVGGGGLCSLLEIANVCAKVSGATVEQSRRRPRRKARILNWVDDTRARRELAHKNTVTLVDGVSEIFASP